MFEFDTNGHEALAETSKEVVKVEGFSKEILVIKIKPLRLGSSKMCLNYIINRQHIF
jgi:hypothetical protein